MSVIRRKWSQWLIETGELSQDQLDDAIALSSLRQLCCWDALLTLKYVDCWTLTRALSVEYGYPTFNFYDTPTTDEICRTVPEIVARDFNILPVMISESVLYYATPHIEDINHRSRLEHILNRDLRPMWAPASWVHDTERKYYAVCHVTEYGSAMHFAKYGDLDWLLVEGNRYREYAAHRDD